MLRLIRAVSACLLLAAAGCAPSGSAQPAGSRSAAPAASATHTAAVGANTNVVIAQLNMWYFGPGCYGGFEEFNCGGRRTTPFEPALGHTYRSADPDVISQQIDWAADYGVDAFSLEWTTPREVGGSLEPNIEDAFLAAPNLHRIRWCIYYDFILRLDQTHDLGVDISQGIDLDNPVVYQTFVADMDHFAERFFGQQEYLKIDGRPVITLFADWNYRGDLAGAIRDARAAIARRGYDVYLVGEEARGDSFDASRVALFDSTTTFNFATPGVPDQPDMGRQAQVLDEFFQQWRQQIAGLRVVGRDDFVGFQPAFGPQEDNRLFAPPSNWIYVPARSKADVEAVARVALANAVPVGSQHQNLIWVNTWNNWAEGTTIEPTAAVGPKYPAGNYQFDMLEVMRDVFGPQTFESRPA